MDVIRRRRKIRRRIRRSRRRRKKDEEWETNDCPHCKKFHRKKPHAVEPEKCMWNKKYKGYRFKSICDELEVEFKPRITFDAELLGGYADSDTE